MTAKPTSLSLTSEIRNFLASYPFSPSTKRTYEVILSRFIQECDDLASLDAAGLIEFLSKPEWGNSRQTVALAACQKYIRWKLGDQHPALKAKIKRIPGKPQRALTEEQVIMLLNSFDTNTAKGARDIAICTLALDTGLRESELCRLQLADTDLEKKSLEVIVKGGHWAAAVFSEPTANHIRNWLNYRKAATGHGFLFTNILSGEGLTPPGLQSIVHEWGKRIGIKLSPHDFRRSFAILSTHMGAPERVLMAGGRWSHSDMILRYTRTLKLDAMRKYLPVANLFTRE